jgi:hypothetical protein
VSGIGAATVEAVAADIPAFPDGMESMMDQMSVEPFAQAQFPDVVECAVCGTTGASIASADCFDETLEFVRGSLFSRRAVRQVVTCQHCGVVYELGEE